MTTGDLITRRGAAFSPCRRYRLKLWIVWDDRLPYLNAVMLNPSTADEVQDDPTVARQTRRAAMLGYGGLYVTNALAWRDTDPANLYGLPDPVGPGNDDAILEVAKGAGLVLCGWGSHLERAAPGRTAQVLALIRTAGKVPHVLKLNADGSPKHPLYVTYDLKPHPWTAAA